MNLYLILNHQSFNFLWLLICQKFNPFLFLLINFLQLFNRKKSELIYPEIKLKVNRLLFVEILILLKFVFRLFRFFH